MAAPTDILLARWQMALSLGFHIVFACAGIAMPLLMVVAEVLWRRSGDGEYLRIARTWAKGTAVLFAVGAVSGTVLSFELGLLFPTFMRHAGAVVGMPFSLEGIAFFTEAIFLGIYLYGWERVRPSLHVAAGVLVALSGVLSAVFVTIANAWMNAPRGFRVIRGEGGGLQFTDIDPAAAMATPFAAHEVAHMVLAAYMATALAAAAIHAWALLRRSNIEFHRRALGIALAVAVPATLAQPLVGHWAGQEVAKHQPLKLAAIEQLEKTQAWAPIRVGPVEIPGALSILAANRPSAVVRGLEEFPRADWPPGVVRPAFQIMVAIGTALAALSLWILYRRLRRRPIDGGDGSRRLLQALVVAGPTGFIAVEAGWVVTEVGRQPWIIYDVMRTADAVTPMPGLVYPFVLFTLVYLGLAATVALVLVRHVRATTAAAATGTPA